MKSYVFWFALSVLGLVIIHATVRLAELPTYAEFAAVSVFGLAGLVLFAKWS